jgi:hypothetical protein
MSDKKDFADNMSTTATEITKAAAILSAGVIKSGIATKDATIKAVAVARTKAPEVYAKAKVEVPKKIGIFGAFMAKMGKDIKATYKAELDARLKK